MESAQTPPMAQLNVENETGREKGAEWLCRGKQELKPRGFCQRTVNEVTKGDRPEYSRVCTALATITVINQRMNKAQRKALNGGPPLIR
jgi:hypothetical protein